MPTAAAAPKGEKKIKKARNERAEAKNIQSSISGFFLSLLNPYIQLYMMLRVNE